jgi:hypothetical protein
LNAHGDRLPASTLAGITGGFCPDGSAIRSPGLVASPQAASPQAEGTSA